MIEQRNYFKVGDRESVEVANHPMEILYLKCEQPLSEFDMGRKVLTNEK